MMDAQLGERLRELEEAGLAEDTIVFYWGDHGSGMPRNKRWPYDSGLHVPLIVHFPEKWKSLAPDGYTAGGASERRLVAFVDLAPTMLSLAGIEPKAWMQGIAFAGEFEKPGRDFNFGFRGRMDERIDLVRSVTDGRYVYLRQYCHTASTANTSTTCSRRRRRGCGGACFDEGRLNEAQSHFWQEKPAEELYDLQSDRDEVVISSMRCAGVCRGVAKLRGAHESWEHQIRDIGFLPEAEIHARAAGSTPYEVARDSAKYDFDAVFTAARLASSRKDADLPTIVALLGSPDSGVRYWGATGLLIHGKKGFEAGAEALRKALGDPCGSVAIVAAESLGRFGDEADRERALDLLLEKADQEKETSSRPSSR